MKKPREIYAMLLGIALDDAILFFSFDFFFFFLTSSFFGSGLVRSKCACNGMAEGICLL